jgi:ribosomal protein S18 acetylase RimI-like enzyme
MLQTLFLLDGLTSTRTSTKGLLSLSKKNYLCKSVQTIKENHEIPFPNSNSLILYSQMGKLSVEIGEVTLANIEQFKTLNVSTLPVRYTTKFYKELLEKIPKDYIKFAFYNGFAVGSICCRMEVETRKNDQGEDYEIKRFYIMTLSVLPAYRRRGIASTLLDHVLDSAVKDEKLSEIWLHVQTSNNDALDFYLARGFEQTELLENYYTKIEPASCYVLRKTIAIKKSTCPSVSE